MPQEKLTRRNLPHWYMPLAMHFVTYRLAGTLPQQVLDELRAEQERLMARQQTGHKRDACATKMLVHKRMFAKYDDYLDRQRDIHWLDDPRVAALVRRSLYHWNGKKYGLLAFCVMPNHVHLLVRPFDVGPASESDREALEPDERPDADSPLSSIMHSLKSYTAHAANKLLGRTGQFWQHESYDHWVRDEDELERIVAYINANPVKAGLARRPHEFPWCSAHDRYL
jgi:putative DNA methylase